jgi:hypothetical protein
LKAWDKVTVIRQAADDGNFFVEYAHFLEIWMTKNE